MTSRVTRSAPAKRKYRKAWAVQQVSPRFKPYGHPCIFGTLGDARENKDADEQVVQIEYRIVKVDTRTP